MDLEIIIYFDIDLDDNNKKKKMSNLNLQTR